MEHTNTEMIEDLKAIKQYFEETTDGSPVCIGYAIEALTEKTGYWIYRANGRGCYFTCSKCGAISSCINNYCYSCGRKMEVN